MRETPVLEEEGADPLPESNAILLHLAEGTDYLSDDPAERAQTLRWLFWEQSEVIPALAGLRFRLMTGRLAPDAPGAERRRAGGHGVLGVLGSHLDRRQFMVGERYSVADTSLYAYVSVAHEAGFDLRQHPTIGEWLRARGGHTWVHERLRALPAEFSGRPEPLHLRLMRLGGRVVHGDLELRR